MSHKAGRLLFLQLRQLRNLGNDRYLSSAFFQLSSWRSSNSHTSSFPKKCIHITASSYSTKPFPSDADTSTNQSESVSNERVESSSSGGRTSGKNNSQAGESTSDKETPGDKELSLEEAVEALEMLQENCAKLQETSHQLQEANKDLLDKYKLALADTENVRKRMQRQIEDAKEFGIQSFCKDLLEVPDILRSAIDSVNKETLEKGDEAIKTMHEGLKMTESVILKVFKKHGLEQMNPLGQKFDPNYHEALFRMPADDSKSHDTVGAVAKIGCVLHGRTIRPAKVGVVQK